MNKRKAAGDAAGGDEPKAKRAKTSGKPASAKGGKGAARDKDSDVVMHGGSGAGSKKGAGAGGSGKVKPKTSTKGSSAKPAKAAKASDASSAAPGKAAPVTTIAEVAQLEKLIHESKQNANKIVSLIATAEADGALELRLASSQALRRVFTTFASRGDLFAPKGQGDEKAAAVIAQFRTWAHGLYSKFCAFLLRQLHSSQVGLQASALHLLLHFVGLESTHVANSSFTSGLFHHTVVLTILNPNYSSTLRDELIAKFTVHDDVRFYLLSNIRGMIGSDSRELLARAGAAAGVGSDVGSDLGADDLARNVVDVLLRVKCNEAAGKTFASAGAADSESGDGQGESKGKAARFGLKAQQKLLSQTWMDFLKLKFPLDVYKTALTHMHKHILPAVANPLLLADFLTDSYNLGGVVSLLALNGLFILINKHNLDYPNFYGKLYRICQPHVFHAKYRARFFKLVALFMTSKYLPAYLVAAFVKRFARLALSAPPSGCVFICAVIFNLLFRHPACRVLIQRAPAVAAPIGKVSFASLLGSAASGEGASAGAAGESKAGATESKSKGKVKAAAILNPAGGSAAGASAGDSDSDSDEDAPAAVKLLVSGAGDAAPSDDTLPQRSASLPLGVDPFIEDENDPSLCRAAESSLWELKTLVNHYSPQVSRLAKVFFEENMPKKEYDMDKYVGDSYQSLFEKELNWRKNQQMPLAFEKTTALFSAGDAVSDFFTLPAGGAEAATGAKAGAGAGAAAKAKRS